MDSPAGFDSVPVDLVVLNLAWLCDWQNSSHVALQPLPIAAPSERVWTFLSNFDSYEALSGGLVTAHLLEKRENEPQKIHVGLHPPDMGFAKRALLAHSLANSVEDLILMADKGAIGWTREVPMSSGRSQRWQVVIPTSENECMLFSGLQLPSSMAGSLATWMTGNEVRKCFLALEIGIKDAAESQANPDISK